MSTQSIGMPFLVGYVKMVAAAFESSAAIFICNVATFAMAVVVYQEEGF